MSKNPEILEFIDYLSQGVTVFDQKLTLYAWNKQAQILLNFPDEMLKIGTPLAEFLQLNAERGEYGPGDIDALVNKRMNVTKLGLSHTFEREVGDGRVLLVEGKFTEDQMLVTSYTDITELRSSGEKYKKLNAQLGERNEAQAEELSTRRQELKDKNTILEIINKNTEHGISVFNRKLELLSCNSRFLELLEFPSELAKAGTPLRQFMEYNAQRGEYGTGDVDQMIEERMALAWKFEAHKMERVRPDGTTIEVVGTPVLEGFVTTYTDITDLRSTQIELETLTKYLQETVDQQSIELSEKQVQATQLINAIDAMEETIALFDTNGRFLFCNKRFRDVREKVSDFLVPGALFTDFLKAAMDAGYYEMDDLGFEDWYNRRMAHFTNPTEPIEIESSDHRWVSVQDQRLSDGATISIGTDITQLKLANLEKRQIEERFRDFAEIGADWFWEMDEDLRFSYIAGSVEDVFGVSAIDHLGLTREEAYRDNQALNTPKWAEYFQLQKDRKTIDNFEYRWFLANGEIRHISLNGKPFFDDDGNFKGYRGVGKDITARKEIDERIRESEERFRAIAGSLTEVFWLLNVEDGGNWNVLYVNPAFESIWRHTAEELLADSSIWHQLVHPDDVSYMDATFRAFALGEQELNYEYRLVYPDGEERVIHSVGQHIRDDNGKIVRLAGISRDVTKFKQSERALRRSQKMEAIGQLSGGVAHDFNNILSIIQGNLELLEEMVEGNGPALERIEKAIKGTVRGADITRKLLGFSRKNSEQTTLTSVNDFIQSLHDLVAKSLTASITVQTELPDNIWPVKIDTGDFEDALLNLALNARDAMPNGGKLVIETENKILDASYMEQNPTGQTGEFVMITVSDTGSGMSEEVRERVFEPFYTTKPQEKGTGLGLSLVYGFVQRSGGHMKVYSEQGVGTTFRLYLPRADVVPVANPSPHKIFHKLPKGTETILVVDDEKSLLELTVTTLKHLGYKVISASGGQQAMEKLSENKDVDLLFSDIIMPGDLDGYQLAKQAHATYPDLKILLTSGFTKNHEQYVKGSDPYLSKLALNLLVKPYSRAELASELRKILDMSSAD
ncbi:MAG: PAS-domain containing protein [Pseudomonas marincola]